MQPKYYFSEPIIHKITIMNSSITVSQETLNFHFEVKQKPALHQAGIFLTCMLVVANKFLIRGSEFRTEYKPQRTAESPSYTSPNSKGQTRLCWQTTGQRDVTFSPLPHHDQAKPPCLQSIGRIATMTNMDVDVAQYFPQKYLAKLRYWLLLSTQATMPLIFQANVIEQRGTGLHDT